MEIDLNKFKMKLAQQKVYNAWQYVESLDETLNYMKMSHELLEKVYEHRVGSLADKSQEKLREAFEYGEASINEGDLYCTDLNVGGYVINDSIFLKKTGIEFFHYARLSIDVLFQIINAALLGDIAFPVDERGLLSKVSDKLMSYPNFSDLCTLLKQNKSNSTFEYLKDFDNYIKHIKTILITADNSFIIGDNNTFSIKEFAFDNKNHNAVDALDIVKETSDYVLKFANDVLIEVEKQLPNCLGVDQRIQELNFRGIIKEDTNTTTIEHITFFIDVDNCLSELPNEIKVFPLIIKPNNDVYSFDFRFPKIFIKKKGHDENSIMGYAELKNGIDTNEFYRIFEVKSCDIHEYHKYIFSFKQNYSSISLNFNAMEGEFIIIND